VIPRILHFTWIGDESKRPDNCIQTWRDHHPGWEIRIWGNDDLKLHGWWLGEEMMFMRDRELNGVADMMRWQILWEYGGIVVDADSICLQRLRSSMLRHEAFACWENEMVRPGLIAAGYVGSEPGVDFWKKVARDIKGSGIMRPDRHSMMAWQTVGPLRLTESYRKHRYHNLHIFPSHYFIPTHCTGLTYTGRGPVYADQLWGSTKQSYDTLHTLDVSDESSVRS
jgi:mannosyltransferase OCH1-like enzyme